MIRAAIEGGPAQRRAVFELFARQLPAGRRYGVVAGPGRFLDALARFRFGPDELDFLRGSGVIDEPAAAFLAGYRFSGSIWGYAEGELYFPGSPILIVESTFAEALVLETLALSIFNHDSPTPPPPPRLATSPARPPITDTHSPRTH